MYRPCVFSEVMYWCIVSALFSFSLIFVLRTGPGANPASCTMGGKGGGGSFSGVSSRSVELTIHFHPVPRLRMCISLRNYVQ
jgi:uncharacterized membrane protein